MDAFITGAMPKRFFDSSEHPAYENLRAVCDESGDGKKVLKKCYSLFSLGEAQTS